MTKIGIKCDSDKWTIINALKVAEQRYLDDAKLMQGHPQLEEQFKRQAKDCARLGKEIETGHI